MKQIFFLTGLLILTLHSSAQLFLIAHRGGVVDSTNVENSLPALERAVKRGYQMVEIDMRLTKDSVLIIQHDKNFKRYYGVDSAVSDMTWKQISRLVSDKGTKVLTLEDAFKHCTGRMQVMLDNKINGNDTVLFEKIVALLKKYDLQQQALMIGTDESTPYFTGKVRLSCTRQQLEENMHKPGYDPAHYYLFGGVEALTVVNIKWAKAQHIMVVGAVNLWSYKNSATRLEDARKDISILRSRGVTRLQIDSEIDNGLF